MQLRTHLWISLAAGVSFVTAQAEETRVFRSSDGRSLTATVVSMAGDVVTLKREDGKTFEVPKGNLSTEDQTYLTDFSHRAGSGAKKLNEAVGREMTDGTPFAKCKADDLASRLKLRPESQSKYGRSWRLYAAFSKGYQLFGAMPYSVALYSGEDGYATSISIVYANKGDFGSTAGFAQDHFKGGTTAAPSSLAEAMVKDDETVTKSLTDALGAPKTERYGEGKTRRKVNRWDWNGFSFLLSNVDGEYVGLSIVSTDVANLGGKSSLTKDADIRKRLLDSLVKKPNGDVYLSEIPMVDQGPKGYCVPATFERAMRTMGLEADMYLLAMVGQSQAGGGTSVELLVENLRHQVFSKGRRIKEEPLKQLRVRDVKRYIDTGFPVMWRLCSMPEYNKAADKDTAGRDGITDWKDYGEKLLAENATLVKSEKPRSNYHICMIIGYNEVSQEIAVSDSWGARFERRWVPVSVANWASNGGILMILP
jgi:hypothetical protein